MGAEIDMEMRKFSRPCLAILALSAAFLAGTLANGSRYSISAVAGEVPNTANGVAQSAGSPSGASRWPPPAPIHMRIEFVTGQDCPQFTGLLTDQNGLVSLVVPATLGYKHLGSFPGMSPLSFEFQLGSEQCRLDIEIRHWSKRNGQWSRDAVKIQKQL